MENLTTWPRATAAKGTTKKMEERMFFFSFFIEQLFGGEERICVDLR